MASYSVYTYFPVQWTMSMVMVIVIEKYCRWLPNANNLENLVLAWMYICPLGYNSFLTPTRNPMAL